MADLYDKTTVRSLDKGLAVIEALNVQDGLSIQQIAEVTGINRGIVYRLLSTLKDRGYVRKVSSDHRYWLEPMVQALASGYRNEAWIREIVQPACDALGQALTWPINFTTYARQGMIVRACSDYESPLTVEKIPIGYCIPIYSSSTGRVYLAFSSASERTEIMNLLFAVADADSADPPYSNQVNSAVLRDYDKNRSHDRSYFDDDRLQAVRRSGYDVVVYKPRGLPHRTVLSAPVLDGDHLCGVLSIRCYTVALSTSDMLEHYVSRLRATARSIGERLSRRGGLN